MKKKVLRIWTGCLKRTTYKDSFLLLLRPSTFYVYFLTIIFSFISLHTVNLAFHVKSKLFRHFSAESIRKYINIMYIFLVCQVCKLVGVDDILLWFLSPFVTWMTITEFALFIQVIFV